MEADAAFDSLVADLLGEPISYLSRGYGSAVFIEFGILTPRTKRDGSQGHPEGRFSLGVEWSWRIEDGSNILAGSWSEEELWEPCFARLRGARVESLQLFGRLPEVELDLDSGVRFISFSTTDGQPQWHLVDHRFGRERWFTVRNGKLHLGDGSEPAY
jgi:hypothetical protein